MNFFRYLFRLNKTTIKLANSILMTYTCNALYTTQYYHGPVMDRRGGRHKQAANGSNNLRAAEYGLSAEVLSKNTAEHL